VEDNNKMLRSLLSPKVAATTDTSETTTDSTTTTATTSTTTTSTSSSISSLSNVSSTEDQTPDNLSGENAAVQSMDVAND
jgi:hypothetical protein